MSSKVKGDAAKLKAKKAARGELEEEEEPELVKANKKQLKGCKKLAADRRKAGEEGTLTDDELEAAGYLAQ